MSTLKANTISNVAGSLSIPTDRVAQGTAFAWVNFNGTGTIAIRASYNVSSLTDNGVGDYTLNLTSAAADANYGITGFAGNDAVSSFAIGNPAAPTTSTCRLNVYNSGSGAVADVVRVCAAIFR